MAIPEAWKFFDPITSETFIFPNNPKEMSSPHPQNTVSFASRGVNGRMPGISAPKSPTRWSVTGKSRSEDFLNTLIDLKSRPYPIHITDHLNRTWEVVLLGIGIDELRPSQVHSTRFNYDIQCLVLGRVL